MKIFDKNSSKRKTKAKIYFYFNSGRLVLNRGVVELGVEKQYLKLIQIGQEIFFYITFEPSGYKLRQDKEEYLTYICSPRVFLNQMKEIVSPNGQSKVYEVSKTKKEFHGSVLYKIHLSTIEERKLEYA